MTLVIASVYARVPEQLDGADLLEIRIDGMSVEEVSDRLPALLCESPLPTVVTCRSVDEGGMFEGEEEERVAMYRVALECDNPPRYLDIEHETLTRHPLLLDALKSEHTDFILSWHDMNGRPKDLLKRATAMQMVAGVSLVKMVWRARSLRDNLEAFSLLESRQQPMIAMCIGEYGLMSRILAPKFGGFAVFASIEGEEATASGQPSTKELRSLYRFDEINSETKVYGVVGNKVAHSASPAFHNAAFEVEHNNAVYLPLPIPSGWEHLKATMLELAHCDTLNFSGASVTIPHKENMTKLLDVKDDNCSLSGATNTITCYGNTFIGNNTDIEALAELAHNAKRVLILGGGGVARAGIVAMQSLGAEVFVATRKQEQATQLARDLGCSVAPSELQAIDTVINCTPVGMEGGNDEQGNPLKTLFPSLALNPSMTVIDTVYIPKETPFIKLAREIGCTTITGDEMFRLQAVAQQAIWQNV
jgi:3-dehydroquinate dehydratase / shikimate dehydrogenase